MMKTLVFCILVLCSTLLMVRDIEAKMPSYIGFNAAACCARERWCHEKHARLSKFCLKNRWMNQQSRSCRRAACSFCARNRKRAVCNTPPILKICFKVPPPYPKQNGIWSDSWSIPASAPEPSRSPNPMYAQDKSSCSFKATHGKFRIGMNQLDVKAPWTRTDGNGITWKKDGGRGIDRPNKGKPFCINIKPDRDGLFYFTMESLSGQFTDHNDAWVRATSMITLYRPSSRSLMIHRHGWLKVFQNLGRKKVADYVLSGDNNGHQLFINGYKDKDVQICVAGRSSRFTIYSIMLIYCPDLRTCKRDGRFLKLELERMKNSKTRCT